MGRDPICSAIAEAHRAEQRRVFCAGITIPEGADAPTLADVVGALELIAGAGGKCLLGPESTAEDEIAYRAGSAAAFADSAATARAILSKLQPVTEDQP